ncbi:DUF4241 domain-containing protein [Promicromonospora sp. NPDC090134]|uniref:DUF4241 domain-containing protein n=1 Tax=Promicromonospora sp. NPDC090134 TaxID=3364408 RepID=UPI00380DC35C
MRLPSSHDLRPALLRPARRHARRDEAPPDRARPGAAARPVGTPGGVRPLREPRRRPGRRRPAGFLPRVRDRRRRLAGPRREPSAGGVPLARGVGRRSGRRGTGRHPGGGRAPADGEHYGVGVDAGTVGFADAEAIAACMPDDDSTDWYDEVFDSGEPTSWFELMDSPDHYREGTANVTMPLAQAGENVVLSHSGWGDGFYPVVTTHAADGSLLGVHIDLLVAGPEQDDEDGDGA